MLYHNEEKLTKDRFLNPGSEYRGAPFWAWNCKMTEDKIDHTLEALKEMGMGGGHIHCRIGLDNPYLSEEFMDLVKYSWKKSAEKGMLTWLYDEDRWPSGAGGGLVTKDHQYRIRCLLFTPECQDGKKIDNSVLHVFGQAVRSDERTFLGKYQVRLKNGYLEEYKMIDQDAEPESGFQEWFAYMEVSGDNPWFNNEAYLNTLDRKAVERFIEVTHEKYYKELGEEFGNTIPSIFTDEPQFSNKQCLSYAEERVDITIPYTHDLEESFLAAYGHSLLEHLPELFWELPNGAVSRIRYEFHDHIAERFAEAFADTVGDWCREHNISFTGHLMEEPTLETQTAALGEAMRSYRSFSIPGIDMLCDRKEFSTAKQAQSAVHQYGREAMSCEIYGVTNWDFDFRGHKLQGDWLAALGVTVRVPHLTWTSMAGEAKRDYPAAIGYQSPWYREYPMVENYFARLNTALTRGVPHVKVAVIHPIESYWLFWGPREQTSPIRDEMDENFLKLIEWLLYGMIDFDFVAESLLFSLNEGQEEEVHLKVGHMKYDVVLVPNCLTLRSTTLEILERFQKRAGKIIFAGQLPKYVDAIPSEKGIELAKKCQKIEFSRYRLLEALKDYRDVEVLEADGKPSSNIIYEMREEDDNRWLFLCHVNHTEKPSETIIISDDYERTINEDLPRQESLCIRIRGLWNLTVYDAMNGEIYPLTATYENGSTVLKKTMYDHDSLLLWLEPLKEDQDTVGTVKTHNTVKEIPIQKKVLRIPDHVKISLSEPNVSVLDIAEYAFDEEDWQYPEEVLRIDNLFREKLGIPLRTVAFAQPWTNTKKEGVEHTLSLRFSIYTETELQGVFLAMENDECTKIILDKKEVKNKAQGWYVDRCIRKVPLPDMEVGIHELVVVIPYNSKTNIESMFLLGDFAVHLEGRRQVLMNRRQEAAFADITYQGYPFYGGNMTYKIPFESKGGEVTVRASLFRSPVLAVSVDGEKVGHIAFSPYEISLGKLQAGKHMMELTVFGNRVNTFGAIHNCDQKKAWHGPTVWRTTGDLWAYEYQIKPTGLLKAPVISELEALSSNIIQD